MKPCKFNELPIEVQNKINDNLTFEYDPKRDDYELTVELKPQYRVGLLRYISSFNLSFIINALKDL